MNIRTIASGRPFLDVLARWWLAESGPDPLDPDPLDVADGLILLPTRRAARALTDAFLRVSEGRPLLLPRIVALGALDEAPLALDGALDLPPAVEPAMRLAILARMVLQMGGAGGAPRTADGAWRLARDLGSLLDEAYREGVVLADTLPQAAEAGFAAHWQLTVRFLTLVTTHWPIWLADNGRLDGVDRGLRLLDAQAARWAATPPAGRVVVAGTTGGVRAVAGLMRVVAGLDRGCVVLPGLDLTMPDDLWAALGESHPQAGMARLLTRMGALRGDVLPLDGPPSARSATIDRALLPAAALPSWRDPVPPAIEGLWMLETADQQEEAVAIALALRDALEVPHARAALVTPDRALAVRVAAELTRYGVIVDDSAGEALAQTPPAAFLRLLARAVAEGLSPVALLSVLKHPLAAFGLAPAACRRAARQLELRCLRGPAPPAGIAGLRARYAEAKAHPAVDDLLDRIETRLVPLLTLSPEAAPAAAFAALIEAAEAAAETATEPGARLWAQEEGEALATHLAALTTAWPVLPPQRLAVLPELLDAALEGEVVRSRRALRGREGAEHPRVVILGLLEARLQAFDVLVMGGLAEGVWPAATDPGPWMSRPMRQAVGLEMPEVRVGQMAHDFAALACAAPTVILSCPRRRDGAPSVPARWLVRLRALLDGQEVALAPHPASAWAARLDEPASGPKPVAPPAPRPPVAARPRRLSVTEIETWLRDPYAIYARRVIGLRALDPLEQNADAADYGTVVHKAAAAFMAGLGAGPVTGAALRAEMDRALDARALRPALAAWWRPRLHRIADWFATEEQLRRADGPPPELRCEVSGEWPLEAADFTLRGVADRVERRADGMLALLDYKTGTLPAVNEAEQGYNAQLLLEAAMAAAGAFGPSLTRETAELTYWRLTGGIQAGEIKKLFKSDPVLIQMRVAETVQHLLALIAAYDAPERAYLSQPHPGAIPRFSDYAQLARVAEWAVMEDE